MRTCYAAIWEGVVRHRAFLVGIIAVICVLVNLASGQTPAQKLHAFGEGLAHDIDRKADRINDPPIIEYLQRIENRIAIAAGVKPLEVRLTRNEMSSAVLLPNGVLYLSSALLEQLRSEAELAGLLAHELAHGPWETSPTTHATISMLMPPCVLSSPAMMPAGWIAAGWIKDRLEREQQATAAAVKTLETAGYDPEAVLELLSKLSYNNPAWSKAIVSDDLLDLRAPLEAAVPPADGYLIDGSEFLQMHGRLATLLGHGARRPPSLAPQVH